MLDSDLAELYGVETKVFNQAVRRNLERFPEDFMMRCDFKELEDLRSQFVTSNPASHWKHKRRTPPMLFTENGVAMLSSILNTPHAIQVNIAIIRVFVKLRSFLAMENSTNEKVVRLEKNATRLFKIVFERMDTLEEIIIPKLSPNRKKIGLKGEK
jgi:hypothetical protein